MLDALTILDRAASPSPWFVRYTNDGYCTSAVLVMTTPDTGDDVLDHVNGWEPGVVSQFQISG